METVLPVDVEEAKVVAPQLWHERIEAREAALQSRQDEHLKRHDDVWGVVREVVDSPWGNG